MPKSDAIEFETALSLDAVKSLFSSHLSSLHRKVEFGPIERTSNPFDSNADFDAYASLSTISGGGWVVQIYITDHGDTRGVTLVALGSGAMGRLFLGVRNTVSIGRSRRILSELVDQFKTVDSSIAVA